MAEDRTPAAEGTEKGAGEGKSEKKTKKGKKRLLLFLLPVLLVAAGGGYFAYTTFAGKKGQAGTGHGGGKAERAALFSLDPFVVNLSEPGRYLKVTMQFELSDPGAEPMVTQKVPILRDAIITLISSQPYEFVSSAEGKLEIKDEILLRANNVMGREVFRNLYFTDFVMQ